MIKARETTVSKQVSGAVQDLRIARGWTIPDLSNQLHDHRCKLHPEGFQMSPAVIAALEYGVSAQHGYGRHVRSVTADELVVLAEVFGVTVKYLLS